MSLGGLSREETYAVYMSIQISLALKFLRALRVAVLMSTWMGVFSVGIVGLHMRFPVVASFKELATDPALMSSLLRSGSLTLFLHASDTWKHGRRFK